MKSAWTRGGFAILQAGLVLCLATSAWAADKSTYRSESAAPRAIQPILDEGGFNTADQQEPAPPAPPELGKPYRAEKAIAAPAAVKAAQPACAACEGACGACESCDSCSIGRRKWLNNDDCCDDCGPTWTVDAGAIVLHRSGVRNYVIDSPAPLRTSDVDDLGWATGPRIGIVRHSGCWDAEFLYWGMDGWGDDASALGRLLPPAREVASYGSRLYNMEFNLKRKYDAITLLAGMRYMQLQERFRAEEQGLLLTSFEELRTGNYLYGAQVGAEADIWCHDRINVTGFTKTGVFANHVREWSEVGIEHIISFKSDNTRNETGFVTEIGLNANVQLTKGLSAYAGYEVMWLDGVVLAPDTIAKDARTNTPVYHGANFGVEFRF